MSRKQCNYSCHCVYMATMMPRLHAAYTSMHAAPFQSFVIARTPLSVRVTWRNFITAHALAFTFDHVARIMLQIKIVIRYDSIMLKNWAIRQQCTCMMHLCNLAIIGRLHISCPPPFSSVQATNNPTESMHHPMYIFGRCVSGRTYDRAGFGVAKIDNVD